MHLSTILYQLSCSDAVVGNKAALREELLEGVKRDGEFMGPSAGNASTTTAQLLPFPAPIPS